MELKGSFESQIAKFAFSLYSTVKKKGNECISPHSISSALLLLTLGADGRTEQEMIATIFNNIQPANIHQGYHILDKKLIEKTNKDVTLAIANGLFGNVDLSVTDSYKAHSLKYYGSALELLDFKVNPDLARKRINDWIASKTCNIIQDMLPIRAVHAGTKMVLANAVYFKGTWDKQFDKDKTSKESFYTEFNGSIQVDMMHNRFRAFSGDNNALNCKVLQLHYVEQKLSMVFMLPNELQGLSKLESALKHDTFKSVLDTLKSQDTIICLPKFKTEADYELNLVLLELGIKQIFDPTKANFAKMVSPQDMARGLYVSNVLHKTFIEVNEEGSEAAAATVILMPPGCIMSSPVQVPFQFVADHPFLYLILDNETKSVLFIGRFCHL